MNQLMSALSTTFRKESEIIIIAQYMISHFAFIKDLQARLSPANFNKIFQELQLEQFNENESIFEAGEVGRKMYFILEGEVAVFTPKSVNSKKQEISTPKAKKSAELVYADFKLVAMLSSGNHFGEIALQNKVPRTATVVSSTHLILASLSYKHYQFIIRNTLTQVQKEKLNFLEQIPILEKCKKEGLLVLLRYLEEVSYNPFTFLYRKNDPTDYIYFIKEGTIQIEIKGAQINEKNKQTISLFQIADGQHFGEYEMLMLNDVVDSYLKSERPPRCSQAQCLSQCTLYRIPVGQFFDTYQLYANVNELKQSYQVVFEQRKNQHLERLKLNLKDMSVSKPKTKQKSLSKLQLESLLKNPEISIINPELSLHSKIKAGIAEIKIYDGGQTHTTNRSRLAKLLSLAPHLALTDQALHQRSTVHQNSLLNPSCLPLKSRLSEIYIPEQKSPSLELDTITITSNQSRTPMIQKSYSKKIVSPLASPTSLNVKQTLGPFKSRSLQFHLSKVVRNQ